MPPKFSRRDVLISSLEAASLLAAGGLGRAFAAGPAEAPGVPDRSKAAPSLPVAIQRCTSYQPQLVRATIDNAFDLIGGIKRLVSNKTVTIKINVTGGPGTLGGLPGYRTYQIHPNVLAAVCGAIHDAGAKRIVVVESHYSLKTPEEVLAAGGWDVKMILSAGGNRVSFEDTRNRGKWSSYSRLNVPWGGFIYPAFLVNQAYEKTDVFVSLAKLKDHASGRRDDGREESLRHRPDLALWQRGRQRELPHQPHGRAARGQAGGAGRRARRGRPPLAGGLETSRAADHGRPAGHRPVDLCVIDGIETNRGGEGPWCPYTQALKPGLLLAGRNAVCTDAVGATVMGYDPQAGHGQFPFPGDNHLLLLARAGVGTIDPKRIEALGLPIEKALFPFNPKRLPLDVPTTYNLRHDPFAAYA